MIETYNTILQEGQDEIVEKKSRFIGYAVPVSSEEEAYAFVEKIRKQHYDARHNCYAFAIGSENTLLRFSDDGEPQGTAGKPILEVITGNAVVLQHKHQVTERILRHIVNAYRLVYQGNFSIQDALQKIEDQVPMSDEIHNIINFIRNSKGIVK